MGLQRYRKKRDFSATPEPRGAKRARRGSRFVVHEHHASTLHFDLRLEIGGVLKSWSVPKGPSMSPADKRLAVEVEDHPVEYASFEGRIPEGQYGAGLSLLWDEGKFVPDGDAPLEAWEAGKLSFRLEGKRLRGGFSLVEMKGRREGKPQWLLIKRDDEYADLDWRLEQLAPDEPTASREGGGKKRSAERAAPRRVAKEKKPEKVISRAAFLKRKTLEGGVGVEVAGHEVALTSLDKPYWPDEGITKGDLLRYYMRVGPTIMKYLADRPAILKRYPNGLADEGFFQHDVRSAPEYVVTKRLESETGRRLDYAVYTDLAALLYLVNIGTIAHNPWHSRVDDLDRPDYAVFDLDPHGAPFENVLRVALALRDELDARGLRSYPKTSGSTGVHVYVPVAREYSFEEVADFAEAVSNEVAAALPKIATVERRIAERKKDQIYVDWQQNARGKSAASVYSARAKPGATVSAPLEWQEVERGVRIDDFSIESVPERLAERGDLWKGLLRDRQRLPEG